MKRRIWMTCWLWAAQAWCALPSSQVPVYFEPAGDRWEGQWRAQWVAHTSAGDLAVTETGALAWGDFRLRFANAHPSPAVPLAPMTGHVNRFLDRDPGAWRAGIPTFARIRYPNLYPGIDLLYYGRAGKLECDFILAPYADPGAIVLDFSTAPVLSAAGDLIAGGVRLERPRVFQGDRQGDREISGVFTVEGRRARFRLAPYDHSRALTIDPVIQFSTYFGGPASAQVAAIATDSAGNLYLTGQVSTPGLPVVNPIQTKGAIWVAKLDPTGSTLIYSTYFGGSGSADLVHSIAVDAQGSAFVAGSTNSADFPTVKPLQRFNRGALADTSSDAFVVKLDSSGGKILFSTWLGGGADDSAAAIALDAQGNAYLTGRTESIDFPTAARPLSSKLTGAVVAFATKISGDGSALVYSTYLGGSAYDVGNGIAVDAAGEALVLVYAASRDFPGLRSSGMSPGPVTVVTKLNPTGSAVMYTTSTGAGNVAQALAADASGNAWLAGVTTSVKLAVTAGGAQKTPGGDVYFRSTDGGATFTANRSSITTSAVNGLANAPAALAPLYAATADGVFQSLDDGVNWTAINKGLASLAINAVAVDPQTPAIVYAAPAGGTSMMKSVDSGGTWVPASDVLDDDLGFACLAIDPNSSTIYAGGQGVSKSGDGGQTWTSASAIPSAVVSLAVDPNGAIVYAGTAADTNTGTPGGLFISRDFGRSFASTQVVNDTIAAIVSDPNNPGTVYAAGAAALYKSADSGATWSPIGGGVTGFAGLAFDPAQPAMLYACLSNGGVYRSADGGATLTLLNGGFQTGGATSCVFSANSVLHLGAVRGADAFLMKLNAAGAVSYATYLGGRAADSAAAVALDAAGNVWVAGTTASQDFPLARPAQSNLAGPANAFVAQFNSAGALVFSTFFGGSASDGAVAMAVAPNGNAYVAGVTSSPDFPLVNAMDPSANGGPQPFVLGIGP